MTDCGGSEEKVKHVYSSACPTYFRACVAEARKGGSHSYADAAWHLAIHLRDELVGPTMSETQADAEIERLNEILSHPEYDHREITDWFEMCLPRCMALVPRRRYDSFVEGVMLAWEDGRLAEM